MCFSTLFASLVFLSCASLGVHAAHRGISLAEKVDAMEYILVEQAFPFTIPITPCSNFVDEIDAFPLASTPMNTGQQSSAQWIRLIFHDFITADVAAGTGGLDASIGFESNRDEDVGKHFINDTFIFFNVFSSTYVSISDMIALGGVMSLRTCGGEDAGIKLRVGRIDATEAGPSGVPQAFTDLDTTLSTFKKAGFNQTEAITAVACGHSLGGVHYVDFPTIVGEDTVTANSTDGTSAFDSTADVFDHTQLTEYLTGTGKCGGPLVIGSNVTTRSDLRLFQSDSNATVKSLSDPDVFHSQCAYIFQRMIDTVPSFVTLSDPILPKKWKIQSCKYDLTANGVLSISGRIRYLCGTGLTCPAPLTLSYAYDTLHGPTGSLSTQPLPYLSNITSGGCGSHSTTVVPFFGNFSYYCFSNNISSSTAAIDVQNEYSYPLFPSIIVLASNTSLSQTTTLVNGTSVILNTTLTLSAAALTWLVRDEETLDFVFYVKGPEPSCSLAPFDIQCTQVTESDGRLKRVREMGEYTVFEGSQTWPGGDVLGGVVQVGTQDIWSMSVALRVSSVVVV